MEYENFRLYVLEQHKTSKEATTYSESSRVAHKKFECRYDRRYAYDMLNSFQRMLINVMLKHVVLSRRL